MLRSTNISGGMIEEGDEFEWDGSSIMDAVHAFTLGVDDIAWPHWQLSELAEA